jgi:tripartite-type tricarboxylate transporter receptor subunit TctC
VAVGGVGAAASGWAAWIIFKADCVSPRVEPRWEGKMKFDRRKFLDLAAGTGSQRPVVSYARGAVILIGALTLFTSAASAQTDFPNRRIQMIVPYPAGGIADISTRIVTDKLAESWHQPIIVEAKPAASGNLAWDQVSRAQPDGYTWIFLGPATMANPRMYAKLRWSDKNFIPVGVTVWAPSAFVVHPSLPVNTLTEFIDYVRGHRGALNWAIPGTGSSLHLNAVNLINLMKLDMTAVPYNGQPPAILDVMANRVQFAASSIGLVTQHVDSGALRPLAVIGTTRSPFLPNVPTVSQAGYPEINVVPWYGYAVPRGTPQPIVEKITAGINETMKIPSVRDALQKQGLQPMEPMSASELAKLYEADAEKYAKVIRESNIRISD